MYLLTNTNPHVVTLEFPHGQTILRVRLNAKGKQHVDLSARQAEGAPKLDGVSIALVEGTSPAPEPTIDAVIEMPPETEGEEEAGPIVEVLPVGDRFAVFVNGDRVSAPTSRETAEAMAETMTTT